MPCLSCRSDPGSELRLRGAIAAGVPAGGFLGAVDLPAVVFLPPHCIPASCGAPPVLPLVTQATAGRLETLTTAAHAAKWASQQRM